MKILFIHDYPPTEGGGVEVSTFADAKALVLSGQEVCIATTRMVSESYTFGSQLSGQIVDGVNIQCLDSFQGLKGLIDWADIVHVQATFSLRDGMMVALRMLNTCSKSFVVGIRTTMNHLPFSALAGMDKFSLDARLSEFAAILNNPLCIITAPSQSVQASLTCLGVEKQLIVVHNARDWCDFTSKAASFGGLEHIDISYIGEISWMKGMHILLGALSILEKDYRSLKVRFVGSGQNIGEVKILAGAVLKSSNVEFVKALD